MVLTLDGGKARVTPLVQTMFNEQNGEISPDGRWLAVKISDTAYATPNNGVTYDVSPDGHRFLMIKSKGNDTSRTGTVTPAPSLVFVLNWFQELKQRVAEK